MASVLLKSLTHPTELASLIYFKFLGGERAIFPKNNVSECTREMKRCYELLNLTSRSFAAVIQALDPELRPSICIFYLVLRGLDTVEDDMSIANSVKVPLLRSFHEKLTEAGWTFNGNADTEKDKVLMLEFDVVIAEFGKLKKPYQDVIADITHRMGNGMADFAEKRHVDTKEDYYLYCHYVAGLVGIGLSKLFSASGLEESAIGKEVDRANSMGLFLQKTNIIRDYLEDLVDGRTWYPKEIWGKYAVRLGDLREPERRVAAVQCLNHMVTDALQHVPDVFDYMQHLQNQTVFNFCAIPQVMAISTLALCYDNGRVFEGVVKIRKGLAVSLMMEATDMKKVYGIFDRFLLQIKSKVKPSDPSYDAINDQLKTIDARLDKELGTLRRTRPVAVNTLVRLSVIAAAGYAVHQLASRL
eukprot:m.26713 g.26713  ORF g.26713 m.26713 type:complete len:415 (+) comp13377_c0_seq2:70-1314(+)